MASDITQSSFLRTHPSRILDHLKTLEKNWPAGSSPVSWNDWARQATGVLQEYMWELAHPGSLLLKSPHSEEEEDIFPAKEFLELEDALKTLVNKHYKSVEEVPLIMHGKKWIDLYNERVQRGMSPSPCSFITILVQVNQFTEIFANLGTEANILKTHQLVVENGWDRIHSFMVNRLQVAWQECAMDVKRQHDVMKTVGDTLRYCYKNHSSLSQDEEGLWKLLAGLLKTKSGNPGHKFSTILRDPANALHFPRLEEDLTTLNIWLSLGSVLAALVEVEHPKWGLRQYRSFLGKTGWKDFHSHLRDTVASVEKALRADGRPEFEIQWMLQHLLEDVIKLEYDIVEGKLAPHDVWNRLHEDWLTAEHEKQLPRYHPGKYRYAYLAEAFLVAEALRREALGKDYVYTGFPKLVVMSLVALQLASRLFSFALNQVLLRSTTPQAFGVATLQYDTLRDTLLFLLREGIRGAAVRTRSDHAATRSERQARTLPLLLAPLVLPVFYLFARTTATANHFTLALYAISTVVELAAEPYYLVALAQWEQLTPARVRVEGIAVVTKAVATLVALRSLQSIPERAIEAYGWGQVVYSLTLFVGLRLAVTNALEPSQEPAVVAPWRLGRQGPEGYFDHRVTALGWELTKQSVVKQVLTEGDKLAVSQFGHAQDLGPYAIALNYGSLIARIVFQPIEESSRLYFSSLSTSTASTRATDRLVAISHHLSLVLTFYSHLSLVLVLLVPSYITPLLSILLGSEWARTSAGPTLRAYMYSLPFFAFNGVLESAFQSLADPKWLQRGSSWWTVCTIVFALVVYETMYRQDGWGSRGLVLGNSINMLMRIAFSSVFLQNYAREQLQQQRSIEGDDKEDKVKREQDEARVARAFKWSTWGPSVSTLVVFGIGNWICRTSEQRWAHSGKGELSGLIKHFGTGAIVGIAALSKRQELATAFRQLKTIRAGEQNKKQL
ncbi:glycolipid translocation protein [Sporobolomyces koalae]|uniref:glycolipid translocation protein n=1 Tax=Sporobolomyces koalae TaxID=500713 RepID=UPI00318097CF